MTSLVKVVAVVICASEQDFLRGFRDPIWVPRIRENYQGAQNTSNYMKFSRKFFESPQVRIPHTFLKKKLRQRVKRKQ